ncbi:hypothetical protein [Chryseobacterium indoltheticum]|uniref:hypothetical protein n=1 Tax=Chryseobacterium indoltheticum TaxID=254 RepID=UPI003F494758
MCFNYYLCSIFKNNIMKAKAIITFLLIIFAQLFYAQIDDKFYQPSKIFKPIDLKFEDITIPVEKETITAIFLNLKPQNPKLQSCFSMEQAEMFLLIFMVKPLIENGFQVAMVDFRGYGKSTGTPTHINVAEDGQKFLI